VFPTDTIVALATPPGRGALAVVRLSGPAAHSIASAVLRPWSVEAGRARLCAAVDAAGAVLDRPIVTTYLAPRSYTGEDVVELSTHGGLAVPVSIVAALVAAGARPALPGEFTRRALLNGKMDLAQAEAVGDLVDARSSAMQRAAMAQLDGGLSRRVRDLRDAVLDVEALVAYDIDFPEEDDGPVPRDRVDAAAGSASDQIAALLATSPTGELIRHGAVAVIAGPPNVGKSSLFNAALGRARSIVSAVPGTTRDAVDAFVEPPGAPFPLKLVDTAGLRDTSEALERLGIEVSLRALADAHVVLACGETSASMLETVARVRAHTAAPVIGVRTKCDRGGQSEVAAGRRADPVAADSAGTATAVRRATAAPGTAAMDAADLAARAAVGGAVDDAAAALTELAGVIVVDTSAETGHGLHALMAATVDAVVARWGTPLSDAPVIMRTRQRHALERAEGELAAFRTAWAARALPAVVAAVHLRAAATALEDIIGVIDVDDVLERVFREFCVGK
jgi:tRNA modification GTPase